MIHGLQYKPELGPLCLGYCTHGEDVITFQFIRSIHMVYATQICALVHLQRSRPEYVSRRATCCSDAFATCSAMQLFSGRYNFDEGKPRANFDNFWRSFLTMFQVCKVTHVRINPSPMLCVHNTACNFWTRSVCDVSRLSAGCQPAELDQCDVRLHESGRPGDTS